VTSSITVIPALLWEKLSVYDQIIIKKQKSRRDMILSNFFYVNFHLRRWLMNRI